MIVLNKRVSLLLFLTFLAYFVLTCTANENLIRNPSFEEGLSGWDNWIDNNIGTYSLDGNLSYTGEISVVFQGVRSGSLHQRIQIEKNKSYKISTYCKTNLVGRNEAASLYIRWQDGNGNWDDQNLTIVTIQNPINPDEWYYLSSTVTPPKGAAYCVVMLSGQFHNEQGTAVWFDEVEMYEVDVTPPIPPQNCVLSRNKNGSVSLNWDLVPASDGDLPVRINIYRSINPDFKIDNDTLIGSVGAINGWIDNTLENKRLRYYYRLVAFDKANNSAQSDILTAKGIANLTGKIVINVSGSLAGFKVKLHNGSNDYVFLTEADGRIHYENVYEGAYELTIEKENYCLYKSRVDINPDVDVDLGDITMEWDDIPPTAPENVLVVSSSPGLVDVSWSPSVSDDVAYYRIYRIDENGVRQLIKTEVIDRNYTDLSVKGGKRYIYIITGVDFAKNESAEAYSEEIIPDIPPVPSPINPVGNYIIFDGSPNFKWNDLDGADKYDLELSKDRNFTPGQIILIEKIANNHTYQGNLTEGTWYWRVRARFLTGVIGDFSEPESFDFVMKKEEIGGSGLVLVEPQLIAPKRLNQSCQICYVLDELSTVSIRVFSTDGLIKRSLVNETLKAGGLQEIEVWDGKDDRGNYVANGLYLIEILIKSGKTKKVRTVGRVIVMN